MTLDRKYFAYIITAYRDPIQLNKLICALDDNSDFYIHIDKKVDVEQFNFICINKKNVFFTPRRLLIQWGGFCQVLAQKELLKCVFESGRQYDRIICLSGMDYPLFSNNQILSEFASNPTKEYIIGMNISACLNRNQKNRILLYHFFRDIPTKFLFFKKFCSGSTRVIMSLLPLRKKIQVKIKNKLFDVFMGSDYWALTYDCALYVYNIMCSEKHFMKYFKHSFVPSEMCIQTIVFNSSFASNAILFPFQNFQGLELLTPLHYIEYRDNIAVYDEFDYSKLMNSGKMFFRKAATGKSDKLILLIDNFRN